MAHNRSFVLPEMLYVRSDVNRLLREIEALEESTHAAKVRPEEQKAPSRLLQQIIDTNVHDGVAPSYQELKRVLTKLHDSAPVVQLSFAANPTSEFMARIVSWFRSEVHPYVMVQIGLQPSIAAGCVVRTPNQYFDLTMRKHFQQKRDVLVQQLRGENEHGK